MLGFLRQPLAKELLLKENKTLDLLKGTSLLSIGAIASALSGFIFRYVLVHAWVPERFGSLNLILSIVNVLLIPVELNLSVTATVFIARGYCVGHTAKRIFYLFVVLVAVCSMLTFLGILLMPRGPVFLAVFRVFALQIWGLVILSALQNIGYGIARGRNCMKYEAWSKVVSAGILIALILIGPRALKDFRVSFALVSMACSQIVALVVLYAGLAQGKQLLQPIKNMFDKNPVDPNVPSMRELARFSFLMTIISMMSILLTSVDKMLIPSFLSIEMLGFYAGAAFIATMPKIVSRSFLTALLPMVAREKDASLATEQYLNFLVRYGSLALVGYAILIWLAPFELKMILPAQYSSMSNILRALLVASAFSDFFALNATVLQAAKNQTVIVLLLAISIVVVGVNIAANYLFIPRWGLHGAAYAQVVSFALASVFSFVLILGLHATSGKNSQLEGSV